MSDTFIKTQCPRCFGTGSEESGEPPAPHTCTGCSGGGYQEKDKLDTTDIMQKLDDIWDKLKKTKEKCDDIWDKVKNL